MWDWAQLQHPGKTLRSVSVTARLTNLSSKPLWLEAEWLRVDAASPLGMSEQHQFNNTRRILEYNKGWRLLGVWKSYHI